MDCYICHNACIDYKQFCQNPLVKNWYPEKIGVCNHSFCEECLREWLIICLVERKDFSCPTCRFVYIPEDRLYHANNLYLCIKERRKQLVITKQ